MTAENARSSGDPNATGPLSDVTILAAEHLIAAPFATQLLSDLGARVIRVERPSVGPIERSISPFVDVAGESESLIMYRVNRNKESLTLDLNRPEGRDLFVQVASQVDVVLQNFRPGLVKKLGIDYESLKEVNPSIVYVSISGYGQDEFLPSPYSNFAAYGNISESLAGITHSLMESSDHGFRGFHGMALGDIVSGLFALSGLFAALHDARRTGIGCHVDVAMMDSLLTLNERAIATVSLAGSAPGALDPPPGILGNFRASDGWFTLTVLGDEHWPILCETIGRQDLIEHEGLSSPEGRAKNLEGVIREAIEEWASSLDKSQVAELLRREGLAAAPVLTAAELLTDPHVAARDMLVGFGEGDGKSVRVPGNPVKLSNHEAQHERPPRLGEHTDSILWEFCGLSERRISDLRDAGVV